jgi:hypothetical protein
MPAALHKQHPFLPNQDPDFEVAVTTNFYGIRQEGANAPRSVDIGFKLIDIDFLSGRIL